MKGEKITFFSFVILIMQQKQISNENNILITFLMEQFCRNGGLIGLLYQSARDCTICSPSLLWPSLSRLHYTSSPLILEMYYNIQKRSLSILSKSFEWSTYDKINKKCNIKIDKQQKIYLEILNILNNSLIKMIKTNQ